MAQLKLLTSVDLTSVFDILMCNRLKGTFDLLSICVLQNFSTMVLFYGFTRVPKSLQDSRRNSVPETEQSEKLIKLPVNIHMLTKTMSRMLIQYKALPISLRS
jgi:hypothetical protein